MSVLEALQKHGSVENLLRSNEGLHIKLSAVIADEALNPAKDGGYGTLVGLLDTVVGVAMAIYDFDEEKVMTALSLGINSAVGEFKRVNRNIKWNSSR